LGLDITAVEQALAGQLTKVPGIRSATTRSDLLTGRFPDTAEARSVLASFHPRRSGNVLLVPEPFWYLSGDRYGSAAAAGARRTLLALALLGVVLFVVASLFRVTPTGFVPDEDKRALFMQVMLPDAASQERTIAVAEQVQDIARAQPGVESVVSVVGFDLISGTAASNGAFIIVRLDPWEERESPELQVEGILMQLAMATATYRRRSSCRSTRRRCRASAPSPGSR
jgi:multidrug efflux pump subunit AcrB